MSHRLGLVALLCLGGIIAMEATSPACPHDSLLSICAGSDSLDPVPAPPRSVPPVRSLISGIELDALDLSVPVVETPAIRGEMPWIWRVLRDGVYRRLPRYDDVERDLEVVFAPVIVDGPYDTVPGVGVEGGF